MLGALLNYCGIDTLRKYIVEVRVMERFLSADSGAFFGEHLFDKIFSRSAYLIPVVSSHVILTFPNRSSYIFSDLAVERRLTA